MKAIVCCKDEDCEENVIGLGKNGRFTWVKGFPFNRDFGVTLISMLIPSLYPIEGSVSRETVKAVL